MWERTACVEVWHNIDAGNSLAVLLKAGGWSSAAFLEYLRADHTSDAAVGQGLIDLSDPEDEM